MSLPRRAFNRLAVQVLALSASALGGAGCARPATLPTRSGSGGVTSGLVILAQFPGLPHAVPRRWAQRRFSQELPDYVAEMSYGRVRLHAEITETWHTLPRPVAQYAISPRNLEVDKTRVRGLIDDALNAVDRDVDVSKYDFTAIFLGAKREEYGMVGLCGWPGMLGWSTRESLTTARGHVLSGGVAIFCYQAHLGTLFHDVGHILGGVRDGKRLVPCLYDHDLQARPGPLRDVFLGAIVNMGFWDPMSCHFHKWEIPPPGLSSWTRLRLGWVDPGRVRVVKPTERTELLLGPLADASANVLAVKIPLSASTYYLIENRQPVGFDRYLPGQGVLVMFADDTIAECRRGQAPVKLVNADPTLPRLEGAAFDFPRMTTFEDEKHRFRVTLLGKEAGGYRIRVEPLPR
ncbi:MAG: hypothetical protein HYV93_20170 [Candidatus Rokubacteria bacterium]|nr:hypothetical protein [Candidatus Rokubacteria bacterium]